jgi:hypothetical protein
MAGPPPTVVSRAQHLDDRLRVTLVDLADPDARPLAALDLHLPPGSAAVIVGLELDPTFDAGTSDPRARRALAGRLLDGCADALRALGRRRVTVSVDLGDIEHIELLTGQGYRVVRDSAGRRDLVLEL